MNRLFQINIRHFLYSNKLTSPLQIPDDFWLDLKKSGFGWIWFLGCWQIAPLSINKSKELFDQYPEDRVIGSCFAIEDYILDSKICSESDFIQLKAKLNSFGLKLMLDFIPNHFGLSQSLLTSNPEIFLTSDNTDSKLSFGYQNQSYCYGRDPNFDPWQDTLQLDYSKPTTHEFMFGRLQIVSRLCDAVRCDMAMLILPEVFDRTWSKAVTANFWQESIAQIKAQKPEFIFLAEVYWDLESQLLDCGFDYFYHKKWLDNILHSNWSEVLNHDYDHQALVFLENHDENRIASYYSGCKLLAVSVFLAIQKSWQLWQSDQIKGAITRWPIQILPIPEDNLDCIFEDTLMQWLQLTSLWQLQNIELVAESIFKTTIQSGEILFFNFGESIYNLPLDFLHPDEKYKIFDSKLKIIHNIEPNQVQNSHIDLKPDNLVLISTF
jgi:hypothetical protein